MRVRLLQPQTGVLAPGMLADITVLSHDVTEVPTAALPATMSLLTIGDGRVAYAAPEISAATKRRAR